MQRWPLGLWGFCELGVWCRTFPLLLYLGLESGALLQHETQTLISPDMSGTKAPGGGDICCGEWVRIWLW